MDDIDELQLVEVVAYDIAGVDDGDTLAADMVCVEEVGDEDTAGQ